MREINKVFWGSQFLAGLGMILVLMMIVLASPTTVIAQSDGLPNEIGEGCLLHRSPISGKYEQIPLTHTDVSMDVRGLVVSATVTQQYANNSNEPIEAVYIFPLPHDGAVYDMEIRIGDRIIHSVIRERAEAKRIYEAAKSEGKRAALVEQERPNIFTTSVANIMPGDKIDVRLRYVQPLRWEQGKIRLMFPTVVGPRYIPGMQATGHEGTGWSKDTDAVPDASRITPIVRNPANRSGHDISIKVDLDAGFSNTTVKSISHQINTSRQSNGRQRIELVDQATIPNKDFILEIQQDESKQVKPALFLSPSGSGETHFLLTAFPPTVQPQERVPVEMLYMIDQSGSMAGTSIEQARDALLQALDRWRPGDRFDILAFNDKYQVFSQQPLAATPDNVAAARKYVEHLQANGGTEMLPALLHLMKTPETPGYLRNIILLTDGDLGNDEQIFDALNKNLGNTRLFTVAIGTAPNLFLATKMAQYGRGTFTPISNVNEVGEQMGKLLATIESPVLTDIKLTFEGVELADVYPSRTPDLFLSQPLVVYGRITKGRIGKLHITGRAGNAPYETTIAFDTSKSSFHPGITTIWARQRVEDLMDKWRTTPEEKDKDEIRKSIISHAIKYRLVTQFTSLVAIEERIVNEGGQQKTVPVPTELPEGMKMEKVFGAPATGTADAFLETLGITLLFAGAAFWFLLRRKNAGALS